jgi:hypothetical protein
MITRLSSSLIEQLNVNRRTCHIAMKVVSEDTFRSVVWGGVRWQLVLRCLQGLWKLKSQTRLQEPYGSWYMRKNTLGADTTTVIRL